MMWNQLKAVKQKLALFGLDNFILALLSVVLLAWLFPEWGAAGSPLPLKQVTGIGVSLIFFFYGVKLSPEKLKAGLRNTRLHLLVQNATFLFFPLLIFALAAVFAPQPYSLLWLGVFFLAALPSTVSSSVVMVSIAGGNIPAAIFNASISGLIGIVMTPFWMGLVMNTAGWDLNPIQVVADLLLKVVLPVGLGLLLHPVLGKFAAKGSNQLRLFDQTIILLIVFMSFAESFAQDLYADIAGEVLLLLFAGMGVLFGTVYGIIYWVCKRLQFNKEDTITAVFCGSKKSLVHGTVMASVIFKGQSATGVILLPTMLYHTIQLIAAGIIAQRMAGQKKA